MPLQCKRPPCSRAASVPSSLPDRGRKKRIIGSYCAVPGCSNYAGKTKGKGVSYFKFPREPKLLGLWVKRIRRKGQWDPDKCHICSTHFKATDFERDLKSELLGMKKRNILKPEAVPSQNLPGYSEEQLGCQPRPSFNKDQRSTVSSLPNDQIIEFEFGSSEESQDGTALCDEISNQQSSDCEEQPEESSKEQEQPEEGEDPRSLELPIFNDPEEFSKDVGDEDCCASKSETRETIITFAGCEQSEHLKSEIRKLKMELKAKEDSLFILEQSSALEAKQQMRTIKELTDENDQLKSELRGKNEKISTLEEALATDTKLRSIFSPKELERFMKRAKKWTEI